MAWVSLHVVRISGKELRGISRRYHGPSNGTGIGMSSLFRCLTCRSLPHFACSFAIVFA